MTLEKCHLYKSSLVQNHNNNISKRIENATINKTSTKRASVLKVYRPDSCPVKDKPVWMTFVYKEHTFEFGNRHLFLGQLMKVLKYLLSQITESACLIQIPNELVCVALKVREILMLRITVSTERKFGIH